MSLQRLFRVGLVPRHLFSQWRVSVFASRWQRFLRCMRRCSIYSSHKGWFLFAGIAYFSTSNDVCCTTRKPYEGFQSREACWKFTASNKRAARCPGVCDFDDYLRSATHRSHRFSKLFITHLDDEFKKQPDSALKHLVSNQVSGSQPVIILIKSVT